MRLTDPLFHIAGHEFSGRDLILIGGGLFLLSKSLLKYITVSKEEKAVQRRPVPGLVFGVVLQIMVLDVGLLFGFCDHSHWPVWTICP